MIRGVHSALIPSVLSLNVYTTQWGHVTHLDAKSPLSRDSPGREVAVSRVTHLDAKSPSSRDSPGREVAVVAWLTWTRSRRSHVTHLDAKAPSPRDSPGREVAVVAWLTWTRRRCRRVTHLDAKSLEVPLLEVMLRYHCLNASLASISVILPSWLRSSAENMSLAICSSFSVSRLTRSAWNTQAFYYRPVRFFVVVLIN